MKRVTLFLILTMLTTTIGAWADEALLGRQIRGVPGRNAQLISQPVVLPGGGTIGDFVCDGQGFWLETSDGRKYNFYNPNRARGFLRLPPGTYRVYPNLRRGQQEARVSLDIRVSAPPRGANVGGVWEESTGSSNPGTLIYVVQQGSKIVRVRADVKVGSGSPSRTSWEAENIQWDGVSRLSYTYRFTRPTPSNWVPGRHDITFTSQDRGTLSARAGSWSARMEVRRLSR